MTLVARSRWGAVSPRSAPTRLASTRGVKIHYTGSAVSRELLHDHDLCASMVRGIQRSHMNDNGWNDLAYNGLVCPHGHVLIGRGPHVLCAANGEGLNMAHYALCALVGNKGLVEPTPAMLHGLVDGIEWLRREGRAGREVKGHRDGYATDCPGGPLYAWVKAGAKRPGAPATKPPPGRAPAWPGRMLTQPPVMRGDDVRTWQAKMKDRGWSITVDGAYGPQSESICRRFQGAKNLTVDGIVGPVTWAAAWS